MLAPDLRTSLSSQIKSETQVAHTALESALHPSFSQLHDGAAYAQLLRQFYGFYAPVERAIAAQLPDDFLPDMTERRKAASILSDLRALGETETPDESNFLPEIHSGGAAIGALYVLEGSTLGGRQICKMIRRSLPDAPLRFFEGYGADTGARWLGFQGALDRWAQTEDATSVLQTATQTFETFRLWICSNP